MGLMEIAIASLCFNSTCISPSLPTLDEQYDKMMNCPTEEWLRELERSHFTVATVENYPLSYVVNTTNGLVGKGTAFEIFKFLQIKFKFNYSVIVPPSRALLDSNNTGIFGLLQEKKADLAVALFPMTAEFWNYAEFAYFLDVGEWVVLMKRPKASASGSGLLAPFDYQVWILIVVTLNAVGPIMYCIILLRHKLWHKDTVEVYSLSTCFWFLYGAILKQGTTLNPASDTSRILFATWWLFITILTAFYTANLTAFLTLSAFTLPIKSAKDIAAKRIPWVSNEGGVIETFMKNSIGDFHAALEASPRRYVLEDGSEILEKWVNQRNYIYIGERPGVDLLMYQDYMEKVKRGVPERNRCTFVITSWPIYRRARTFVYTQNFKYSELFNTAIQNLVEAGLVKRLMQANLPSTTICPLNLASKERRLKNTDLLLTYYIVALGFSVAVLTFCMEMLLRCLTRKKKRKPIRKNEGIMVKIGTIERTPSVLPFSYQMLMGKHWHNAEQRQINGRDYLVIKTANEGDLKLIPLRTPSSLLFHRQNYNPV